MPPDEVIPLQKNGRIEKEQTLNVLLQRIIGQDGASDLNTNQIDEVLNQRRQVLAFIHDDKKRESFDTKFVFVGVLIFVLLISVLVLWKKPDVFSELLSFLVGLFGGSLGGYGFGKNKST